MTNPYRSPQLPVYDFPPMNSLQRCNALFREVKSGNYDSGRAKALFDDLPLTGKDSCVPYLQLMMLEFGKNNDFLAADRLFALNENGWDRKALMKGARAQDYNTLAWAGRKYSPRLYHPSLLPATLAVGRAGQPWRRLGADLKKLRGTWKKDGFAEAIEKLADKSPLLGIVGFIGGLFSGFAAGGIGFMALIPDAVASAAQARNFIGTFTGAGLGLGGGASAIIGAGVGAMAGFCAAAPAAHIACRALWALVLTAATIVHGAGVGMKKAAQAARKTIAAARAKQENSPALPRRRVRALPAPGTQASPKLRAPAGETAREFSKSGSRIRVTPAPEPEAEEPVSSATHNKKARPT